MVAAALQEMFLVMADAKGVIARNQFTVASLLQALMMHTCGQPRCLWQYDDQPLHEMFYASTTSIPRMTPNSKMYFHRSIAFLSAQPNP